METRDDLATRINWRIWNEKANMACGTDKPADGKCLCRCGWTEGATRKQESGNARQELYGLAVARHIRDLGKRPRVLQR